MNSAAGGKRQAVRSFSWLMSDKVIALGGAAIINIAIARHLGAYEFGLLNYVLALAAFATSIGTLGLSGLITRDLMYRPDDEARILGSVSVLTTAAMTVVTCGIAAWVFTMPEIDPRIPWLLLLVVAMGVFRRFEFLESWFVVHGKVRSYAMARILVTLFFMAIKIALLLMGASLQLFLIVVAAETALSGIRSLVAYRLARGSKIRWEWNRGIATDALRRSWPILLAGILSVIYLRLDVLMLAWWSSPVEAGIYSAAARISEVWYFIPQILMNAVFPGLLSLKQRDFVGYQKRIQDILDLLSAGGSVLAIGVTLTAWWFIPLLYGEEYHAASLMLMIHIWAGIFVFMRAVLSKWLIAEELYIFSLVTHAAGAIVNIALNIALIPSMGGVGAAIATLISYATAGFLSLLLHRRTRGMFFMMLKSLLWPRRIGDVWRYGRHHLKAYRANKR